MKDETAWQFFKTILKHEEVQAIIGVLLLINLVHLIFYGLVLIGLVKLAQTVLW